MASIPGASAQLGQTTTRTARTGIWIAVAEGILQLVESFGVDLSTEQHVALLGLITLVVNIVAVQIEQRSGTGLLRDPESEPVTAPVISPSTGVGAGGNLAGDGGQPAVVDAASEVAEIEVDPDALIDQHKLVEEPVHNDLADVDGHTPPEAMHDVDRTQEPVVLEEPVEDDAFPPFTGTPSVKTLLG